LELEFAVVVAGDHGFKRWRRDEDEKGKFMSRRTNE
jgi:hypothetical protein